MVPCRNFANFYEYPIYLYFWNCYIYGMDENEGFELGWGFYVLMLMIIPIVLEAIVRPMIYKLTDIVNSFKRKLATHGERIKKIRKWMKFRI